MALAFYHEVIQRTLEKKANQKTCIIIKDLLP